MYRSDDRRPRLRDLRDVRREQPTKAPKRVAAKVFWVFVVLAVTGVVVSRFAARPAAEPLPVRKPLASLRARDLQEQATQYAIEGGALAGTRALAAESRISVGDTPADPEVIVTDREFVVHGVRSSHPYVLPRDRELAEEDALAEARRILTEKVGPGNWEIAVDNAEVVPPSDELRAMWREGKLEDDRGWLTIDAKLTHDSIRHERAKGRTAEAGFWFGTVFLALLALYGFLRLDTWTKGYLTLILGIGVGAIAVAAVVGLGLLVF